MGKYPVVTAPTIALDFLGTTQQSASHNVAPNQVLTTRKTKLNQQESSPKGGKRTAQLTARNSAASRSLLSSKQPPILVGKERSFQEVSNATKNSKNGGQNQREIAIDSDGEQ
ncbi:hypothetical protein F511_30015 [Dorcoceras hygrometricum]|uniref:Uncharacterized protein n=1 Tax=Dorcoceras hygrometricum TaxID=472368 RepID=A0A2Z7BM62_9LAMI|nr:hypothetical protein F511_30015 [Dorcoceras hygrometricum]